MIAAATAAYAEYLQDHPDSAEALHNRGIDYAELDQLDSAAADGLA